MNSVLQGKFIFYGVAINDVRCVLHFAYQASVGDFTEFGTTHIGHFKVMQNLRFILYE